MRLRKRIALRIHLSDDLSVVTVHVSSRSSPIVVGCLGVDYDEKQSPFRIYTNGCFHDHLQAQEYEGWRPYGAISTILEKVQ